MSVTAKTVVKANLPTEVESVMGVWTGGGAAADCTHSSTKHSAGITSVVYNAATGKYKINLSQWGQQLLPGSNVLVRRQAGDAPLLANLIDAVTVASDGLSAYCTFEVWDVDATSALTDLATTDTVAINLVFAKGKPTS